MISVYIIKVDSSTFDHGLVKRRVVSTPCSSTFIEYMCNRFDIENFTARYISSNPPCIEFSKGETFYTVEVHRAI